MRLDLIRTHLLEFINKGFPARQLRRLAARDLLRGAAVGRQASNALTASLLEWSALESASVLERLESRREGLSETEAEERRQRDGLNEVDQDRPIGAWMHLWYCYCNPFNLLLTVLATISWLTEDVEAAVVIGSMVAISTLLRFIQEKRSNRAAEKLKAMVSNTATVFRSAEDDGPALRVEVPIRQLVPGDVLWLSAGDMVPADVRLLSAKDLFVGQAALTGESLPVEKFAQLRDARQGNPLERDSLCFMGTTVVSGSALAVVIGTGTRTYFGSLAERVIASDPTPTAFQTGVNRVSWLLIRFMLVMAPVVLLINGFTKGDWLEAALFALSIAVGLTPEMLPMIVTSTLAKGAVVLSRRKVIVKRLDAIQNFGAMDILCTDKTGTLTQDRIVLERHTDAFGQVQDRVLQLAFLNSHYQTGLKNLLDVAVLEHVELRHALKVDSRFRKLDEIPFDFARRRMSVVVSEREDNHLLICKGALEEVLAVCESVETAEGIEPLTGARLDSIRAVADELNQEGLRVVAVATRELPPTRDTYGVADESRLCLAGYIAFLDPPKETTAPALRALAQNGVAVKVLTGDNDRVSLKVCRDVGLVVEGVLLGPQLDELDDTALGELAERTTLFAKLTPSHKERLVRVLRERGHVVGFLGDGINDAPALRTADIGISVDSAVDIAKEAADLILLEKSLMVLEEGVIEGRRTFANMLKYIRMTASSNFGNVFSVLVASAFIPFLPMLPLQLLVQNLLYDLSQVAIPFDHVDDELLRKPQQWNPDGLGRFMVFFGPISSIFDIATFLVLWHVFGANSPVHQTLFQSGWFVEGLISQLLVVHMIRTRRIPFLQSRAAWPLLGMTLVIVAVAIFLPMGPLAHSFRMEALPLGYWPWLVAILLGYMALTQAVKGWFARRYGWQ
ncbi:magnesium-translocating P-type ATPase [Pseudomonas nitroreducens]|uniref:Magnesium-transporting ATPase, P-type 1 n=1 Tax=Pseudomonas nitroreducens TaxID=46680 RepID=A0A6G6IW06_PSENT|nr:magnesium-translocating P-type ATPase [Pseudomonas nitroreducens]NMZ58652.1 magnesium-translocating P-type ATPase [Pseudomonas nitroreducens]QIE87192.1 magnesium-translocating P-type ATPase [Pseudomonas nitroreducens]WEW95949.1 magnesium-translocating P-type ATPase [Pseudomonas nitroreducens]SNS62169.1 Mg2+-importing ATPase [Pseudomonas nitroreducens]